MARTPEKCFCGKLNYKSESQASVYAQKLTKEYGKKHRPYKCQICPNYCLTTKPFRPTRFKNNKEIIQ